MQPQNPRSVDDMVTFVDSGARPKFVFFWGHKPQVPGRIDESCLSNWFPAKFNVDGIEYATTEHFMMAEKARLFGDEDIRSRVVVANSPGKAKSLGRRVSGFDEGIWTQNRYNIVVSGILAKFTQNKDMGELLKKTGSKVLVEASPHDRIWGIGMGKDNEHVENPRLWNGLNLLGFALMEVRECLTQQM